MTDNGDLTSALAELNGLLLERVDVTDFLEQVAVMTASLLPGSSCGITVRGEHGVQTAARSDSLASAVDEVQYGRGVGPCLEAMHTGRTVIVADLVEDGRWDGYRIHAIALGVRSSLSLPLSVEGQVRGALNIYDATPGRFTEAEVGRGEAFAHQASLALTLMLRNGNQETLQRQLWEAITTRAVVDQAVGIVMGQRRIDAREAFGVLRATSQSRNRKLRDVAADLIEAVTGHPPVPPRPFVDPR